MPTGSITETQRNTLSQILKVKPDDINAQITYMGDLLTSVRQSDIETELTRWTTAKTEFYKIHPREANFGAEINSSDEKDDIRDNIAYLLERPDWSAKGSGSAYTFEVVRG